MSLNKSLSIVNPIIAGCLAIAVASFGQMPRFEVVSKRPHAAADRRVLPQFMAFPEAGRLVVTGVSGHLFKAHTAFKPLNS